MTGSPVPLPNLTGGGAASGGTQYGAPITQGSGGNFWLVFGAIALTGLAVYVWKKK